jgi:regulator of RNase E activity RraA
LKKDATSLTKRLDRLFTTLVCDILDDYYDGVSSNNYLMQREIKPVLPGMKISGVAKTFRGSSSASGGQTPAPPSNQKGDAALESVGPGQVVVYGTDGCTNAACWGDLMTTAAAARGAEASSRTAWSGT